MFSVQKSNFRVSGATLRVRFWHCMIIEKLAPEYFQHFAHFNVQRGADLGCSRFVVFQVTLVALSCSLFIRIQQNHRRPTFMLSFSVNKNVLEKIEQEQIQFPRFVNYSLHHEQED